MGSVEEVWLFEMFFHEIADQNDHVVGKSPVLILFQQQCDRRAFYQQTEQDECEKLAQ